MIPGSSPGMMREGMSGHMDLPMMGGSSAVFKARQGIPGGLV